MNRLILRISIAILAYGCVFLFTQLLEKSLKVESSIPNTFLLSQATFEFDDSKTVPVQLPHNWDKSFPNKGGIGHYHFRLMREQATANTWGIYLPKLSMNASVSINGINIGNGGSMHDPVARYWNLPLYFIAPQSVWKTGINRIDINIAGYPNGRSGISPIFVGPHETLHSYFDSRNLSLILLDVGSFAINLILGSIILIWAWQTRDRGLFYFGLGAFISCIPIADSFWTDVNMHRFAWRWLTHSSLALSIMLFYLFMLKMMRRSVGVYGKTIMSYLVLAMVALLFANEAQLLPWAKWLHLGNLFLIVRLIYICISKWVKRGDSVSLWLGGCMFIVLNFGFADWLPAVLNEPKNSPYIFYIGPVAFSFAVSLGLLARYISALSVERHYSENLQSELTKQEQLLDQQFQTIAALEKEKAVDQERDRIMRELHDGIGGQLMGALALSEPQQDNPNSNLESDNTPFVRKRIRYALDELRLMMDSLDKDAEFETALAMLRQRIAPELQSHNIELVWDIDEPPIIFHNSPGRTLHGLRLIQEAIVNILKHANATTIEIHLNQQRLIISDNGHGFNVEEKSSGRGLSNIQWRAIQLDAELNIESSSTGTFIRLQWRDPDDASG